MKRRLALIALLMLAACHRRSSEVMPGADAEARHAAAQQTLDDLAAADAAAIGPPSATAPRTARTRPITLVPDNAEQAAPQLPVAANVAEEEAPAAPQ